MSQRYGKYHHLGKVSFFLNDYTVDLSQAKFILSKLIEQAVKDYCYLDPINSKEKEDPTTWETANSFLFDNDHYIEWGNKLYNFSMICEILDLNPDWVRLKTKKKLEKQFKKKQKGSK